MTCCAPGAERLLENAKLATPSPEELRLASRRVGDALWQTDLAVPGVHCGACISAIEKALGALPGVEHARLNLSTKRVVVRWRDAPPSMVETLAPEETLGQTLADLGLRARYGVTVVCVKPGDEGFTYATADTVLEKGDVLVVAGPSTSCEAFARMS